MTTQTKQEMTIPRSRGNTIYLRVISAIVVLFLFISCFDIINRLAFVAPILWLCVVTLIVWTGSSDAGSIRQFLLNCIGEVAGRKFVEAIGRTNIRFGFELFGLRIIQRTIPIEKIQTVEWSTGQASSMVGRDMNDWSVSVRFYHDDPVKKARRAKWPKTDLDLIIVGPSTKKEVTEALGLSLLEFLRNAGAVLAKGESETEFVRVETGR